MKKNVVICLCIFVCSIMIFADTTPLMAQDGDWPVWRGLNRDGKTNEQILAPWAEGQPKEVWRKPLGAGFSSVTVLDGKLYTMFSDGESEFATCLSVADGV